ADPGPKRTHCIAKSELRHCEFAAARAPRHGRTYPFVAAAAAALLSITPTDMNTTKPTRQ
ncbi:MAG TPA: hypothetical protein VGL78_16255, partial [Solirubrobacteraceae bacterium]